MSKRVKWSVAGAVGLVIVLVVGLGAAKRGNKAVEVRIEEVKPQDLVASVTASGQVRPQTKVDVASDVAGKITQLSVKEGQMVTQGAVPAPDRSRAGRGHGVARRSRAGRRARPGGAGQGEPDPVREELRADGSR